MKNLTITLLLLISIGRVWGQSKPDWDKISVDTNYYKKELPNNNGDYIYTYALKNDTVNVYMIYDINDCENCYITPRIVIGKLARRFEKPVHFIFAGKIIANNKIIYYKIK